MDYCKYVNVFQGCGEIDLPTPKGIATKWFFIKAGCGNTSPAATVPFGAMSVSPFSGGYPTGYGNHKPNSHSRPPKFSEGNALLGFAHLQHSGTGAIGYYMNYAVITPRYQTSALRRVPKSEKAEPGYYSCVLEDINCELSGESHVSHHRYTFGHKGGYATVNFKNNGLDIPDWEKSPCDLLYVKMLNENTVLAEAVMEGIHLHFALRSNGKAEVNGDECRFTPNGNILTFDVAISLRSTEKALSHIEKGKDFDGAKEKAKDMWNHVLSKIEIETDSDEIREIFYSNLYHSFVKPADWAGESFVYDGDGPFSIDLNTLWDMYKTALPLLFMLDRYIGIHVTETLLKLCENLGYLPNSIGLSSRYQEHDVQARMLGAYVLLTAYRYGIPIDVHRVLKVIETDVFAENKTDFTVDGKCKSHTWMLDMADGCALAAEVAKENGETEIYEKLFPLSKQWITCFDKNTGLLNNDSDYYEGTLYNYSFRQMVDMDKRIELAGGKENFVKLLDQFFGYGAPDTVQPTDPFNYEPVREGIKLGRFEGFNNESDTETPFSYIYADRQDRTAEIIRAGMKYMFTTGRGGLPGNNDTCALSSYYCLAALGIFPVAGQDLFLIGSPLVKKATVHLYNSNTLTVLADNNSDENIYVKDVAFNGKALKDYRITAKELLEGGTLSFTMSDRSQYEV